MKVHCHTPWDTAYIMGTHRDELKYLTELSDSAFKEGKEFRSLGPYVQFWKFSKCLHERSLTSYSFTFSST